MFDEFDNSGGLGNDDAHDLLRELENNTPEEIRRQRHDFRIAVKAAVIAQPGNVSDRMKLKMKGVSGDVSQGGFGALFPIPPRVGDIYLMTFDRKTIELPILYARCVRCQLLREDAFEGGFKFFKPIALPKTMASASDAS
jgi:hypothetical protein